MKINIKAVGLLMLVLTACSGTYNSSAVHDDIYFSPSQAESIARQSPESNATPILIQSNDGSSSAGSDTDYYAEEKQEFQNDYNNQSYQYNDTIPEGTSYMDGDQDIVNNYYYGDDYYNDYHYSSRIRRFHRSWYHFNYYDPYFTNMYWYNYNPYYYGWNTYMGYDPFFSFGYGFPSYYYGWGYRPWGWTHYGYGWGYGSPWGWGSNYYGYWPGYHSGYYYGNYSYNEMAYNPRRPSDDPVTGFGERGPGRYRGTETKTNDQAVIGGSAGSDGRFGGSPSTATSASVERVDQINVDAKTGNNPTDVIPRRGSESAAGNRRGSDNDNNTFVTPAIAAVPTADARDNTQQPETQTRERYTPQRTPQQYERPESVQQQTPKYSRPQQEVSQPGQAAPGSNRVRTYTPPSQQQPRSNQEYRRPATEQPTARPAGTQPQRPEVTPSRQPSQSNPQVAPQRTPQNASPQVAPQRSPQRTNPQVAPQRSPERSSPQVAPQRAPERSTPQRQVSPSSTPQRSAPSYSPPARSNSGSSSGAVRSSSPSRSSGSSPPSRSGSSSSSPSRRR